MVPGEIHGGCSSFRAAFCQKGAANKSVAQKSVLIDLFMAPCKSRLQAPHLLQCSLLQICPLTIHVLATATITQSYVQELSETKLGTSRLDGDA